MNCDRDDPTAKMLDNSDTAIRTYDGTSTSHETNLLFLLFAPPFLHPFPTPDLKDMSQMVLRTRGPRTIFTGHRLVLHVDYSDADKVGVFYGGSECPALGLGGETPLIIGVHAKSLQQSGYRFCSIHPTSHAGVYLMHRVMLPSVHAPWDQIHPFGKVLARKIVLKRCRTGGSAA